MGQFLLQGTLRWIVGYCITDLYTVDVYSVWQPMCKLRVYFNIDSVFWNIIWCGRSSDIWWIFSLKISYSNKNEVETGLWEPVSTDSPPMLLRSLSFNKMITIPSTNVNSIKDLIKCLNFKHKDLFYRGSRDKNVSFQSSPVHDRYIVSISYFPGRPRKWIFV